MNASGYQEPNQQTNQQVNQIIYVLDWVQREQEDYAIDKFNKLTHDEEILEFSEKSFDSRIVQRCFEYLHRATLLGLANPAGRQALAKFASTAVALTAGVVDSYGELPKPGVPSGQIDV